jgi:ABC-type phosphate transport system substrate-binding protein
MAVPSEANAATCASLTNPVYIAGSSAVQTILKNAAPVLQQLGAPVTPVYSSQGSCVGMDDIVNGTKVPAGTAVIWDNNGVAGTCDLPGTGQAVDIGVSDVFPTTCPNIMLPSGQKDFQGPIQTMTFVVPAGSNETSISAEAAYTVFGYGGSMYQVMPWIDPLQLHIRNQGSGTQQMIATAIGLAASKWKGHDEGGSSGVVTAVAGSTSVQAAIGIVVTGNADPVSHGVTNATLKILAYQHKGQKCGYYPDSSSTTFDKINVRQGRYAIWGPVHMVTAVDGQGNPTNASAATLIKYMTHNGLSAADNQTMINAEIAAHATPQCAMQVSRTGEIGAEASYQPDVPCGCFFESKVGNASSSCKTCTMDTDCTMGNLTHCRYGYCEAK